LFVLAAQAKMNRLSVKDALSTVEDFIGPKYPRAGKRGHKEPARLPHRSEVEYVAAEMLESFSGDRSDQKAVEAHWAEIHRAQEVAKRVECMTSDDAWKAVARAYGVRTVQRVDRQPVHPFAPLASEDVQALDAFTDLLVRLIPRGEGTAADPRGVQQGKVTDRADDTKEDPPQEPAPEAPTMPDGPVQSEGHTLKGEGEVTEEQSKVPTYKFTLGRDGKNRRTVIACERDGVAVVLRGTIGRAGRLIGFLAKQPKTEATKLLVSRRLHFKWNRGAEQIEGWLGGIKARDAILGEDRAKVWLTQAVEIVDPEDKK